MENGDKNSPVILISPAGYRAKRYRDRWNVEPSHLSRTKAVDVPDLFGEELEERMAGEVQADAQGLTFQALVEVAGNWCYAAQFW